MEDLRSPDSIASHDALMQRGSELHAQGKIEYALLAFEEAFALQPGNVNTASACAAMLSALGRPIAAYRVMLTLEAVLMQSADGAANLAITAQASGDIDYARLAYARALELDANHLRSLNNTGLMAAAQLNWATAISCAARCVALAPYRADYRAHLCDALCGARSLPEALEAVLEARALFPDDMALHTRQIIILAFNGELKQADQAISGLDAAGIAHLRGFLSSWPPMSATLSQEQLPDALQLCAAQVFEAATVCDWRSQGKFIKLLRQRIAEDTPQGIARDWQSVGFYSDILGLTEAEVETIEVHTAKASEANRQEKLRPYVRHLRSTAGGPGNDGRIHVGLALPDLRDSQVRDALIHQLGMHDASRFACHVYASTKAPEPQWADAVRPHAASVVELAHMSDAEAAGRIRLDRLDIFIDMASAAARPRSEIAKMRVAPVQLGIPARHGFQLRGVCDYVVSDSWVHPDRMSQQHRGAIVRLPVTCWLDTLAGTCIPELQDRRDTGLPEDCFVISTFVHPLCLDAASFGAWMKILRSLPDAVMWLPPYDPGIAANLVREAQAAGINSKRLFFASPMTRAAMLGAMQGTDLFLDTLAVNACEGLADAMRIGLPALTCPGESMASRMGGSILSAAGLQECVVESREAYIAAATRLGRNSAELTALRQSMASRVAASPLFDTAARIRDWESAWTLMAERTHAGLPPSAFDVPAASAPGF
ncbi:MAG: hypothetical protein HYX42_00845 [Polaromonas sp.]|uniref:O-linked N-acetylglucosamine transferase, SPINDLY family protein n=1 Tax=Polaromonas sp. TaxID=1869339 RepID=UPI0025CE0E23|nr:glycosyltransferase family 41 protein [Polaromonas sp.]MBI2724773.1 hypothetical protein [Polaromonas sp.]